MRSPGFSSFLAATVLGVYILVVVGATASLAEAAAACNGWPLCSGDLRDPDVIVALGHRAVALIVGVLLAITVAIGWRHHDRRVTRLLAAAVILYPLQVAIGALLAQGATAAGLHLFVAIAIFAVLVLALAWHLETDTTTDTEPTPGNTTGSTRPAHARRDAPPVDTDAHDRRPNASPPGQSPPVSDDLGAEGETIMASHSWGTRGIGGVVSRLQAYVELMKPRLMWLLCLVAAAGMALAGLPSVPTVLATLGGGVLAIGAAGTFNHVLERDLDRRMRRTADRPVATHDVPVWNAVAFGGLLTVAALGAFLTVNLLVAALGLAAIIFYSVVYTLMLKPHTVHNTVIGGAAGALPALIGYAAVTGTVGPAGVLLAVVIFVWTPAHFYNLALAYQDDYARGGIPMLPVVHGEAATRKHILYYLGATLVCASLLGMFSILGWLYAVATVGIAAVFLAAVVHLHREQTRPAAMRAFHASNAYLGILLVVIIFDALTV